MNLYNKYIIAQSLAKRIARAYSDANALLPFIDKTLTAHIKELVNYRTAILGGK